MDEEREDERPGSQPITERATKEAIGEGEPGGSEYATDEDAADQADTADERL